ncbi:hypothetical protein FACS189447_02030 [Spirochaetia bacterium]|nr:hypothetical protein FACS189447_02030 [Spirochaetia bacterium]
MKPLFSLILICLLFLIHGSVDAQTSNSSANTTSSQFDMTGFPLWAKDLRRAEIVAFGSFPFTYFFTNFSIDTYRYATHDWDRRYAPWPIKASGSFDLSQDEQFRNLGIAAGGAVLVAVVDHLIVRYKRNKAAEQIRNLPAGTPIIIRRPLGEDGAVIEETPPPEGGDN